MIEDWRDVTEKELNLELEYLLQNDLKAGKFLIDYYHKRFTDIGLEGCPEGSIGVLCKFMQHVFEKMIVDKWKPEQAFGLKRRKGKYPRPDLTDRDYLIAANVILLMRKGQDWSDAIGDTANLFIDDSKGDRAVMKAYSKHKDLIYECNFSDADLTILINSALTP